MEHDDSRVGETLHMSHSVNNQHGILFSSWYKTHKNIGGLSKKGARKEEEEEKKKEEGKGRGEKEEREKEEEEEEEQAERREKGRRRKEEGREAEEGRGSNEIKRIFLLETDSRENAGVITQV